jgi:E3 ubiquitin-protein ligase TRIP12
MVLALELINNRFYDSRVRIESHFTNVACVVSRQNLWEDGLVVLERLAPTRCALKVQFAGENGTGTGPVREFFLKMSTLFRERKDLWRIGSAALFPRPAADPHLIYLLGVLCGKAIALDAHVDLPFDPIFFKVVRGHITEETCLRIDRHLTESMTDWKGLYDLSFLFPDQDSCPLVPGGEEIVVDEGNVNEYVTLLRDRLVCKDLADIFKRGFETVMAWDILNVFTPQEILVLLNGSLVVPFTREELEEHVVPEQGYQRDSPQIQWLFEVMLDFTDSERVAFVQFLTGSCALPVGGLAALHPKLHIAKKLGGVTALPTVSTCQTYLKLPEYTSKEELRAKLLVALIEGRDAFELA